VSKDLTRGNTDSPDAAGDIAPIERAAEELCLWWPGVCIACSSGSGLDGLESVEIDAAAEMTPQRRLDFAAGRTASKLALRRAGYMSNVVVPRDDDGVPVFPDGYVGSIAHSYGRAVAAVARKGTVDAVGVDLEYDTAHDEESLHESMITETEAAALPALAAIDSALRSPVTLVFAAKEAVLKAVFSASRTTLDLEETELAFNPSARTFALVGIPCEQGLHVIGAYRRAADWLLVLAVALKRAHG